MKTYYVYILTNQNYTVLYIGVTNDLARRVAGEQVPVRTRVLQRNIK